MQRSQQRLAASAIHRGVSRVKSFGPKDLRGSEFFRRNEAILRQPKGAGYWLWKPYLIQRTLAEMKNDDVLIYSDAGIEILSDLSPLIELCRDVGAPLIFNNPAEPGDITPDGRNPNRVWTKRDCFVLMKRDHTRYHESEQVYASFNLWMKNESSLQLVNDWLTYCERPEILTDQPNTCGLPDLPGFRLHRHDQSVLSLLVEDAGIHLYRNPSQFGNHLKPERHRIEREWRQGPYANAIDDASDYPTLLNHHRERKVGLVRRARAFLRVRSRVRDLTRKLGGPE